MSGSRALQVPDSSHKLCVEENLLYKKNLLQCFFKLQQKFITNYQSIHICKADCPEASLLWRQTVLDQDCQREILSQSVTILEHEFYSD